MPQHGQRYVGYCHVGTKSGSHERGILTYYAATEDEHLGRLHSRDSAEEHAAASLWLFEEAGTFLDGHATGHFAHGHQQRKASGRAYYGFVCYACGFRGRHGLCEGAVGSEVEVGE